MRHTTHTHNIENTYIIHIHTTYKSELFCSQICYAFKYIYLHKPPTHKDTHTTHTTRTDAQPHTRTTGLDTSVCKSPTLSQMLDVSCTSTLRFACIFFCSIPHIHHNAALENTTSARQQVVRKK